MKRYTTPTQIVTVHGADLTGATSITVAYRHVLYGDLVSTTNVTSAYDEDEGATVLAVTLTAAETASLRAGECEEQVIWVKGGSTYATDIARFTMVENLLHYGE